LTISVSVRLFCTLHLHPKGMCYTSAVLELPYSDMDAWELQDPGHVPKCHTGRFEKLATEIFKDALPPPYVNSISVPSFCPSLLKDPGHVPKCHTGRFEKLATEIFRDALPPPYVNSISVPSFCPSLLSPEAHGTRYYLVGEECSIYDYKVRYCKTRTVHLFRSIVRGPH
jgi:hypothetical protein